MLFGAESIKNYGFGAEKQKWKKEVIIMTNIEIFNLTRNTINIVDENNVTILKIVSECCSPTIDLNVSINGTLGRIPMLKVESIKIKDLPPFKFGTFYIVDFEIAYTVRAEGRTISDLLIVGEPAYGEDGSLIGYRSLSFFE